MRKRGSARRLRPPWIIPLLVVGMAAASAPEGSWARPARAKVETWRQEGPSAFAKCHRESVVISDNGRVRLGHAVSPVGSLAAARVWDLARTARRLAAGRDRRFRPGLPPRSASRSAWTVLYDAADSQVLSLVVVPGWDDLRRHRARTARSSNLTDAKHPASRPDPKVQYIWDLAADPQGNVYAATGPTGQLWKRARDGRWSLLYDSKSTHLLCVAVGPDGTVYAGSDGEGLIYRVGRDGKATVLFDAPQSEIRTLLVAADGALYAGTAAEAATSAPSEDTHRRQCSELGGVRWTVKSPAAVGIATSPFCSQSNNRPMVLSCLATYPSRDMIACACTVPTGLLLRCCGR